MTLYEVVIDLVQEEVLEALGCPQVDPRVEALLALTRSLARTLNLSRSQDLPQGREEVP